MLKPIDSVDFNTQISCLKCGQEGWVTWARCPASRAHVLAATSPVKTSDGFYLRLTSFSNAHIVCARCGAIHRDRVA
jgi:ribosomal protein L37E